MSRQAVIDSSLLRSALAVGFGDDVAASCDPEAVECVVLPGTGGGSFTGDVGRMSGASAGTSWSVVVKRLHHRVGDPAWTREADAYENSSTMTDWLPAGLRMPELLAVDRRPDVIVLVVEDVEQIGPRSLDRTLAVAGDLARFNCAPLTPVPWLSHRFIAQEHRTLADHPERLVTRRRNPQVESLCRQLRSLSAQAPALLAALDQLPHGPAHLDAFTRNLVGDGTEHPIALVDWANVGSAPIGADQATLFVLSLDYMDIPADSIPSIEQTIVDQMCHAMTDVRPDANLDDAGAAFRAVARLRHLAMMMNALPMIEAADPAVSAIVGHPLGAIVDRWLTVGEHLLST